jgi:hypothetical protein
MGIDIGKYAFHVVGLDRVARSCGGALEGAERFALPPPPAIASVGLRNRWFADSSLEGAVSSEPVSARGSLRTGKNTGN